MNFYFFSKFFQEKCILQNIFSPTFDFTRFSMIIWHNSSKLGRSLRKNVQTKTALIIVYNRVPECDSSLLKDLIKSWSMQNGAFQYMQSFKDNHHRWSTKEQQQLRVWVAGWMWGWGWGEDIYSHPHPPTLTQPDPYPPILKI
jgi:hypothetical protein